MSAQTPAADAVMSTVCGAQDAKRLLQSIRQGCAPADALLEGFSLVQRTGDAARVRSFTRELQKQLERSGR